MKRKRATSGRFRLPRAAASAEASRFSQLVSWDQRLPARFIAFGFLQSADVRALFHHPPAIRPISSSPCAANS